jgi:WD40 repeat protein
MRAPLALALLSLALGCRTLPPTPQSALDALAARPGGHLTGAPSGLGPPRVLNAEDFVYDAKPSPDARTVATSRLGSKSFHLTLHGDAGDKRADVAVSPLEFDVDAVEFSPDGAHVAAVCRDGAARVYASADGAPRGAWLTDEPLVSLAWAPAGDALAVGSAKGLVTVLSWPGLAFLGEVRAHADEVRGLAFVTRDGTLELVSGSWDRSIAVHAVADVVEPPRRARLGLTKRNGVVLVRGLLDGRALGQLTLDNRVPGVVVRAALAEAAGVDVMALQDSVTLSTGLGTQVARLAKGRRLAFKSLVLDGVDVAVCDACVPPEAQGVLGLGFLALADVTFDGAAGVAEVTARDAARVASAPAKALTEARRFRFPAAVNDLSVDAAGRVLGVAFSETKAERTREVYQREKRKEVEPARPWDCGARVDVVTGQVLEQVHGHRGVVATAAISPDGRTLATGGWDKTVRLHLAVPAVEDRFGWAIRRVRFSRDGRWLVVAAWTPQNPLGDHQSNPSAVVYEVRYAAAEVAP